MFLPLVCACMACNIATLSLSLFEYDQLKNGIIEKNREKYVYNSFIETSV